MNPIALDFGTLFAHEVSQFALDSKRSLYGYRLRRAQRLGLPLPGRITDWSLAAAVTLSALPTLYV